MKHGSVGPEANIVSSHVINKRKINDNQSLRMEARIVPYGN